MRCLIVLLLALYTPSVVSAQLKRVGADSVAGRSAAVVVPGDLPLLHTTQLLPLSKSGELVGKGDATAQCAVVLQQLKDVLRLHNLSFDKIVKLNLAANSLELPICVSRLKSLRNPHALESGRRFCSHFRTRERRQPVPFDCDSRWIMLWTIQTS